jgi:hypothetical protein
MRPPTATGQSSVEYLIVCAILVTALGIGLSTEDSALGQWLQAMRQAYAQWTYAISLPQ